MSPKNLKALAALITRYGLKGPTQAATLAHYIDETPRLLKSPHAQAIYKACLIKIKGTLWGYHFDSVDLMAEKYGRNWREIHDKKVKDYIALKSERTL